MILQSTIFNEVDYKEIPNHTLVGSCQDYSATSQANYKVKKGFVVEHL